MIIKKIIWVSRHELTDDQVADFPRVEIIAQNITWSATADCEHDLAVNRSIWDHLVIMAGPAGSIAGVFPPVAIESKPAGVEILSPVSAQSKAVRKDGTRKIDFVHVRWAKIK